MILLLMPSGRDLGDDDLAADFHAAVNFWLCLEITADSHDGCLQLRIQ